MTGPCHQADIISQLPDEILTFIISWLTWRDATTTRILSTRWRHFHANTSRLVFTPFKPLTGGIDETEFVDYINAIDYSLDSYKGGRLLEEFRVNLPYLGGVNIERWLVFALTREVKIIDISIDDPSCATWTSTLANLIGINRQPLSLGLKSLKELYFRGVNMTTDQDVEKIVSNFVSLERLCIEGGNSLENLSIHDHHNLRHIDVRWCGNIECLVIRNMINLISVIFYNELSSTFVLELNDVPSLVAFETCDFSGNMFDQIVNSNVLKDQLMCLKLLTDPNHVMTIERDYMLPKLLNLRELEIEAHMYSGCSSHQLIHLIEACPRLEKLEIKFMWWGCAFKERANCWHVLGRKAPNRHLRKVKLLGYSGCQSEMKLADYVIKKADVALKELIIEPYSGVGRKARRRARARAWRHFQPITPNSVNLVVI